MTATGDTAPPDDAAAGDPYEDGFDLILSPADGEGQAAFRVPGGAYALAEEDGRAWCFADSAAFADDGNLVVGDGEVVEVTIFNCGDLP